MHHPRKRFGQHFLTDHSILQTMTRELSLRPDDNVVEIGPGMGALTQYLLPEVSHLNVVEFDRDLVTYLQSHFPAEKLRVFSHDALSFSFSSLSKSPGDLRVVGNLPYNISTPLLFKLFSEIDCIRDMHFMLQKEVALRLSADIGCADYGRLSVMSHYFCEARILLDVPPEAFNPPPRVDSAVIQLTPKQHRPLSEKQFSVFSDIVKEAFNYRRKAIHNSLKRFFKADDFAALHIDREKRPQDLTLDEFIRLTQFLSVE